MGLKWAEQSIEVAAPVEACFDVITDYESYPDWQQAVTGIEVDERDDRGRGSLVTVAVDAKLRQVRYTLRYRYDEPQRVSWDFVEGQGVHNIEGDFTFTPSVGGVTAARYRLGIDIGLPFVPQRVYRMLSESVMRGSVDDLRAEVERRLAA